MELLWDLASFALRTLVIVVAVAAIATLIAGLANRARPRQHLEVEKLGDKIRSLRRLLQAHLLPRKQFKKLIKADKNARKEKKSDVPEERRRLFVLDFQGNLRASRVEGLREEITAVLGVVRPGDEVVLRLESPGGMVTHYGLAAAQLDRLRARGVKLTVCIDRVAASGGYMMAVVADQVCAAPFAVVGSIGVIAQVPNFHRLLKRHDVDYVEFTAGRFKRTISLLAPNTEEGIGKFQEQLEQTHRLFQDFVGRHRPQLDLERVATGETWYGQQALDLKLVDRLITSDDYLLEAIEPTAPAGPAEILRLTYQTKKSLKDKISEGVTQAVVRSAELLWERLLAEHDRPRARE